MLIMSFFVTSFWIITFFSAVIFFIAAKHSHTYKYDRVVRNFQFVYLGVYLLAAASDWIQGPYIYALYKHYGFSSHEIDILFVAGYGSSMVFGTFVGSLADRFGRKRNCLLYALLYSLSCITKHIPNFSILFIGRLISGVATSILCSAFESWLICEHNKNNYPQNLLSLTFSNIVIGNSLVAILAGLIAQFSVDYFGYVAPYDIAIITLTFMSLLIFILWTENYGDEKINYFKSFQNAFNVIKIDQKIQYLGLVQSLFEGSMYTFVLKWTPSLTINQSQVDIQQTDVLVNSLKIFATVNNTLVVHDSIVTSNGPGGQFYQLLASQSFLSNANANMPVQFEVSTSEYNEGHRGQIPHGFIFASFMVSIMAGSSLFRVLTSYYRVESFLRFVLMFSAFSLSIPILVPQNQSLVYVGFVLFELCVGIFWPSMSTLRGRYLPETNRAAIMNIFRVPLNFFVVITLLQNFPMNVVFSCCTALLFLAAFFQDQFYRCTKESATEITKQAIPLKLLTVSEIDKFNL